MVSMPSYVLIHAAGFQDVRINNLDDIDIATHLILTGFYLMSCWYTRGEAQKRFSFFFGSATLAGAFGGVLAYGIGKMNGIRGYKGWRWLFIIEGLLTIVIAVIWFWTLPDFPETVGWLDEEERAFIKAKLEKDTGKSAHAQAITWRDALDVFKDCRFSTWLGSRGSNESSRQDIRGRTGVFWAYCSSLWYCSLLCI
jgi:MFS family permease